MRYPRGTGTGAPLTPPQALPIGKGVLRRRGERIAILNFGTLLPQALEAAERLNASVADMRFVKPLDDALVRSLAEQHEYLVTLEENAVMGGAGSGVNELLMQLRLPRPVLNIGLQDSFVPQGSQEEIRRDLQLDADGILAQLEGWLAR